MRSHGLHFGYDSVNILIDITLLLLISSVCGEMCFCAECEPSSRQDDVVDVLMQRTLEDVAQSQAGGAGDMDDLLIKLNCDHVNRACVLSRCFIFAV